MNDIFSLLSINEDVLTNFHLQANTVGDHQTEKVINVSLRKLKQIKEKMMTDCQISVTAKSVEEVIQKVKQCANNPSVNAEWSLSELRIVSYYLMKLQGDDAAYDFGLSVLDENWKSLYFNGLIFYVLNGWNLMKKDYREKACQLIIKRLNEYQGDNKKYILLKNHSNFFEESGPIRMAALLKLKGIPMFEAPALIGYKPSTFSFSYYSDVIIKMLSGQRFGDPEKVQELFDRHDNDRTKKMVFANYVEVEDANGDEFEQSKLSKCAHSILGDISKSVTWTPFAGATDEEVTKLRRAKELVNQWYVRKVIEVFFEVCVQDYARKIFWIGYANMGIIKDFRIAGSSLIRQKMQNDERISTLFSRYFINTNSKYSQTAALILYIKDKVMVEFSDTGALYVYNRGNSMINFIDKGKTSISSVADLKQPSLPLLVEDNYYYYYYSEEGRHNHRGEWQKRLVLWMQRYVLTSSTEAAPKDNDDNIFVAPPLPEQSPAPQYRREESNVLSNSVVTNSFRNSIVNRGASSMQQELRFDANDEFETDLKIRISSKLVLGRFRVVGSYKGFYIEVGNRYYLIRKLEDSESLDGNIWVKSPRFGWLNIIHFTSGKTYNIGYVKIDRSELHYKEKDSEQSFNSIKL